MTFFLSFDPVMSHAYQPQRVYKTMLFFVILSFVRHRNVKYHVFGPGRKPTSMFTSYTGDPLRYGKGVFLMPWCHGKHFMGGWVFV
jgi:hypothetical protein